MSNPTISQIQLPSGNTYEIKDSYARQLLAGGLKFVVCYDGTSAPIVANIPAGVSVVYNDTTYVGTKSAETAEPLTFYLVKEINNVYSEYVAIGDTGSKTWEILGDTSLDLSNLGTLAYKSNVTLNKGAGDTVLGESTTFTNSSSSVSFTAHSTDKVLGSDATFTTTVTPTTTNIKATASGTAVGADGTAAAITGFGAHTTANVLGSNATFTTTVTPTTTNIKATASGTSVGASGTDTFVKSYPGTTSKLSTTTIPNVTGNSDVSVPNITGNSSVTANKSTWSFTMGSGADAETLIIGGSNGSDVTATNTTLGTANTASKVTLGTAITAATGSLASDGGGASVMTGLGTATTASAVTGVTVTAQPTIALATGATAGTGVISVATGITSASTATDSKDQKAAITALGTPTTANALTGVKVTSQPTVALATGATAGTGVISVATGITSASTSTNNKDEVTALTGLGAGTAAAQTITVGTNDKVSVAKYGDLSVTVS